MSIVKNLKPGHDLYHTSICPICVDRNRRSVLNRISGSCKGRYFIFKSPFAHRANELYNLIASVSLENEAAHALLDRAFADKLIVRHEYDLLKAALL